MIHFGNHGYAVFTDEDPIPPSRWTDFDLLFVERGTLRIEVDRDHDLSLPAGAALLVAPETQFAGRPSGEPARVAVQHFGFAPETDPDDVPVPLRPLVGRTGGVERYDAPDPATVARDVARAVHFAFQPPSPALHDLRVAALTLVLGQLRLAGEVRLPGGEAGPFADLLARVAGRLDDPPSVAQMAREAGLSPSRFRVRFREAYGESPAEHVRRMRLDEAERLLRETSEPIKRIARRVGFDDLPNFYRFFRERVGETPARYRAGHTVRG